MAARVLLSVTVTLVVATCSVALWWGIKLHSEEQISRIAEAESYAARSQLIRNTEVLLGALRNVRQYWATYGHLPRDQWASDAGIELAHFKGVSMLLWEAPDRGVRYSRTPETPAFDYRPSDEEWAHYESLLEKARLAQDDTILGPFNGDGGLYLEVIFADSGGQRSGTLAAVINAEEAFGHMLMDESPGYAIRVYSGDTLLYSRGEAAADAPDSWTREGLIRSSLGTLWRVVHLPMPQTAESLRSTSIDLVLVLGLLVSVLIGSLTFENRRARTRAREAESAGKKLVTLNRELEEKVEIRTRELADRNADLQTLTDSVAHDLRNPLNTISVNVQLLLEKLKGDIDPGNLATLERLQPSVHQMTDILERLLGLSAATHSTFERERVDMRKLVEEAIEDLQVAEPVSDIQFSIGNLPDAYADPTLVQMLIANLLSNAVKYTRDRDPRTIEIGNLSTDRGPVYFVRDNGIGFDADSAPRLFNAFERMHDAMSSEGVGLGLTISRRVVNRHGGEIWAEGACGEGATFFFTLSEKSADDSREAA